jgi:Calcineurin-like phosphoesterase/Bacterial Ig-like domain/Purple acid Phosphatase, N-terminal domain
MKQLATAILLLISSAVIAQTSLISYGSNWKYLDNGTNQGTAWRAVAFNDAAWKSGNAQLGYGDGDETTVVSFGPNASQKYITTYFRKAITVTNPASFTGITLSIKRDDGAVVYINGTERYRTNMPTGNISSTTRASTDAADDGNTAQNVNLANTVLVAGNNVIAVEIHQVNRTSSDISFDLQLIGNGDITAPVATGFNPADNSINVPRTNGLTINFNEAIQKGSGNILIRENGVITQTIAVGSAAVAVAGSSATIDPTDFSPGATVNIEMAAGVFRDLAGNNYAGISNATTWNFNIINPDLSPPAVLSFIPADNAVNIALNSSLSVTFNEPISKGSGNIIIRENAVITQTIDVSSVAVTINGNTASINPADFSPGAIVNIEMATGVFRDTAGNNYAGIADLTTWNFSTIPPDLTPPTVVSLLPPDNATDIPINQNLVMQFDEPVQKGAGTILIREAGLITQTIDIAAASVVVAGNLVTIDAADFSYSTGVNIEISAGALLDTAGNLYSGMLLPDSWNFITVAAPQGPQTLIAYGSSWKYLDDGSNQGTAWSSTAFNDAGWASGNAQLGYGDGDEATIVNFGPDANAKFITTYFRKSVNIASPQAFTSINGSVKRDDGVVIYVNGVEVYRNNMPAGTVTNTTLASTAASDDGNTALDFTISTSAFVSGNNVIAVEIHQNAGTSSDLSFDLQVIGSVDLIAPAVLTFSPADNSVNIPVGQNLVINFDEPVQKGSGNIIIRQAGNITQTIDVNSAAVTIAGSTVTIDPADFGNNASVNVEIAAGVFEDLAGNDYAGITAATDWNFTTQDIVQGPQTFISFGSSWKYLDNGSNQGTAWRATGFNDAAWASGNAQLGYGDGDEATVVSFGPNANAKYITTYFRKTINITNPLAFASFSGSVKRDDGVVIYVNGVEVYRSNMPAGTISSTTLASSAASDDGNTAQNFTISNTAFVSGNNVIAVEMHQNAANSSDLSFDLQLIGTVPGAALLTRGPYLNMGNGTAVTIRWRTDAATNSRVELGTSFGSYPIVVNDAASVTEHEVRVTGLNADTKYFYRFGSSVQVLQAGTDNYFTTQPPATTTRKMRFAAFGDCGRNDNSFQSGSLSAYLNYVGSNPAEAMLLLGDNAYDNGTDLEYQSNYFNAYSSNILKNHQLFPAPGNHDYANSAARQDDHNVPYYSIFTNPANGQSGGVASGTEAYYSWDWGNVHFLSLDSYGEENGGTTRLYDTLGAQAVWVKQDLAANTKPWVVAYWHHPPYTMGSHNSDTESELINMRQNFIRILERMGVDLVLCGHSHDYERSYLLNGHYGNEASFNVNTHTLSNSSGKYDGSANSCTYKTVNGQNHGSVYVVAGSAGADGGVQAGYPHNAMPWSVDDGGMFYFEVEDNRLDAKFIRRTGVISDQFTIMKNVNRSNNLTISAGTPTVLTASWIGNYSWSTGETTRSITVSPLLSTNYTVTDGLNCITDNFQVTVSGTFTRLKAGVKENTIESPVFSIQPTLAKRGQVVQLLSSEAAPVDAILTAMNGQQIRKFRFSGTGVLETNQLQAGVYLLQIRNGNGQQLTKKIVITE